MHTQLETQLDNHHVVGVLDNGMIVVWTSWAEGIDWVSRLVWPGRTISFHQSAVA